MKTVTDIKNACKKWPLQVVVQLVQCTVGSDGKYLKPRISVVTLILSE